MGNPGETRQDEEAAAASPLRLARVLGGPAYGVFQPVLLANLALAAGQPKPIGPAVQALEQLIGVKAQGADERPSQAQQFAAEALRLAVLVQQRAGVAVFESGQILGGRNTGTGGATLTLAMPYAPRYAQESFRALAWAVTALLALSQSQCGSEALAAARLAHDKLMARLTKLEPRGTNSLRFMAAAHGAGIPLDWITGALYQFGWGAAQCNLTSSILDSTTSMGVTLARDKEACSRVLRRGGLPVPEHALARTLEEAKAIALRLGYPVVVKPSDLDGGVGVAAGLQDESQLELAWAEAIKHSKSILVEKHQDGEDFRMIVLDGKLVWTVGRQAAGVTGDAAQTISQLVEQANADTRRGYHATASLRPIKLEEEALALLAEQGLELDSIPARGQWVRLRRAANISSGGLPVEMNDKVHPDNRRLVERATQLLKLDLAGVDFIIPDIERSWLETGAGIIEINAQPQLVAASQTHLYSQILAARIPGQGRIPVAVLVGASAAAAAAQVMQRVAPLGRKFGLASSLGAWLDGERVARTGMPCFDAAKALLAQRDTRALLVALDDLACLKTALPMDRYDLLVVAQAPDGAAQAEAAFDDLLLMLAPHCRGRLWSTSARLLKRLSQGRAGSAVPGELIAAGAASLAERMTQWFIERLAAPAGSDTAGSN